MAGPNLSTHRTVSDSAAAHVADHNAAHQVVNLFDKDATPTTGQTLVFNGTVYAPGTPGAAGSTVFNVQTVGGAVGTWNGLTGADDTSAILATVTAAQAVATAFTIFFPPLPAGRYYKMTSPLPNIVGACYVGASQSASRIMWTTGSAISIGSSAVYNVLVQDLGLFASGSHLIDMGTGSLYKSSFVRCLFYSGVDASSWIHMNSAGDFLENRFIQCTFDRNSTATVPGIDLINSAGGVNYNLWQTCRVYGHNGTGTPAIRLEGTSSSTYLYGNQFQGVTGEQNCGGLIHAYTVCGLDLEDCTEEDATVTYTGHIIKVDSSASSTLPSRGITINRCGRLSGTLGSGIKDIWMPSPWTSKTPQNVSITNPVTGSGSPVIQAPDFRAAVVGDNGVNQSVLSVGLGDTIQTGRDSTGNRPPAASAGVGAMFFDTTLSQPIWSDGSSWQTAGGAGGGVSSVAGRTGAVTLTSADLTDFTEATQDATAAMVTAGTGITVSYNDAANTLTIGNSVTAPAIAGVKQIDTDFTGASDDAKFGNALAFASGEISAGRPNWILQFPNRQFTVSTTRTPYSGMALVGPGWHGGVKNLELSSQHLVNGYVRVTAGSGTSSLFYATGTVNSCYIADIAFYGNSTSQFWHQPSGSVYPMNLHALDFYGFGSILGNQTTKFLCTQLTTSGHWTVSAPAGTQFHLGGSDCSLWQAGYLNLQSPSSGGAGKPLMMLDFLQKTAIGYMYITNDGDWIGLQVLGDGDRDLKIFSGTFEGVNGTSTPATRQCIDMQGGHLTMYGPRFSNVAATGGTPALNANGVITQSGGVLTILDAHYGRATTTGVSASNPPFVYQTGGVLNLQRTTTSGTSAGSWASEQYTVRDSSATSTAYTPATSNTITT